MWLSRRYRFFIAVVVIVSSLESNEVLAAEPAPDPNVISVLSYNVHGLFALVAGDRPGDRIPTIGWLANDYDVVLFQEDFEYQRELKAQMLGKVGFRGNGVGTDPRRLIPKALLAPFALLIPHFWPPYGSGLSLFVNAGLVADADDVDRVEYDNCSGWIGSADCWAAKGFLRVGIRLPNDVEVDVYNTHLDAGPDRASVAARWKQLDTLAASIERRDPRRPVIVGGDLNLAYNRFGDGWVLGWFRDRTGLDDTGAGAELPHWRERDYLLYRHGAEVKLCPESIGEAREFLNEERALSDHPAIYARFRVLTEPPAQCKREDEKAEVPK